jgi:uncharacterized protein
MRAFRIGSFVRTQPRAGLNYAEVLTIDDPNFKPLRRVALGVGGAMLGLLMVISIPSSVSYGILKATYLISGSPEEWSLYYKAAQVFANPAGMLATHLGLAMMIPIAMALVLFVHGIHPRWLHSVQPGFRWRYALLATIAALVILGGLWAVSRIGEPWVFAPEPAVWWFLLVIVLTAPLQAAAEEYFFRGYLMQAITVTSPAMPWAGVVGSALIFAMMHGTQNLPLFGYRFAFGLIAGYLVMKTGGLEAAIAAHVVNNVVAFGYAALSGTMVATRTVTESTWPVLVWSLVGFGTFAAAAIWLAKRMNLATNTPASQFGR